MIKYASLLIWIICAAVIYGVYATQGLPHMIWSYKFYDNGDRYNPLTDRYYTSCTFAGPYGVYTLPANNGKCGWVRLFREDSHGKR